MLPQSQLFFLLIALLSFTSILGSFEGLDKKFLPRVHVLNDLPPNSEPLNVLCKSRNTYIDFSHPGTRFRPKRDNGKAAVFWLVNEHGFFLSWDNTTWVKKSVWETE
ncbi:hypothetical protein M0R45_002508 [Rubus argutus]|uniref:S-protein homolog n=1 Tax=Rubus argutus TaxID=59490 RepID=A0AAW1VMY1_RUBAR